MYEKEIDENFDNFFFMNGQVYAICLWALSRLEIIEGQMEFRFAPLFTSQKSTFSMESMAIIFYTYKIFLQFPIGSIIDKEMINYLMTEK